MKVLITGITGFVGSHLSECLLSEGDEIHGTARVRSDMGNIAHLKGRLNIHECDLTDPICIRDLIREIKPDAISHLAAQSFVHASFVNPYQTISDNTKMQLNLFEAVRKEREETPSYNPWIHVAGSSEEYGLVHRDEVPIKETNPLRPLSPYAVSKITQDYMGQQYAHSYGMNIVVTRAFNHSGIRRGAVFVERKIIIQAVEIRMGKRDSFFMGDLSSYRDFTDVRDMVRAYQWVLEGGCKPGGVYNVCSGTMMQMKDIVEVVADFLGVSPEVRLDERFLRPSDVPVLLGNYDKFHEATGWKPRFKFEETLEEMTSWELGRQGS